MREVDNRLKVHAEPGNVSGFEGRPRLPRGGEVFELWQDHWSPAARALTRVSGGMLALWGLRRFDALGITVAMAGLGLLTRAVTNEPITALTAFDGGERSVREG